MIGLATKGSSAPLACREAGAARSRKGRNTQLPPVDIDRLFRARAVAVVGARRPAALLAARFVRVIQPGASARAQGLTEGRLAPDERTGDVLLAAAGVCLGTSRGLDRQDAGRLCRCFATDAITPPEPPRAIVLRPVAAHGVPSQWP